MSCRACTEPGQGHAHTCETSGTAVAAIAHAEGQVQDVVAVPCFDVAVRLRVEALSEEDVRRVIVPLVSEVLSDDQVTQADFTITQVTG